MWRYESNIFHYISGEKAGDLAMNLFCIEIIFYELWRYGFMDMILSRGNMSVNLYNRSNGCARAMVSVQADIHQPWVKRDGNHLDRCGRRLWLWLWQRSGRDFTSDQGRESSLWWDWEGVKRERDLGCSSENGVSIFLVLSPVLVRQNAAWSRLLKVCLTGH